MLKTPGSSRALRRTYTQLHAEGHIDNKAAVLLRAGEKLAVELKIVRKENEGLKEAIFEEKRKRKRGKALNFYEGEAQGQALFFSPEKVARARQRLLDEEAVEMQQKSAKEQKKLQTAISRDEKAREKAEKKAERDTARAQARAEVAREKAAKLAEKEAKKAQKAREAEFRKAAIENKRQICATGKKKDFKTAKIGEKRSVEEVEVEQPRKRARLPRSQICKSTSTPNLIVVLESTASGLSANTNEKAAAALDVELLSNAGGWSNSVPLRSGRNIRPPKRFL